MGSSRSLVAALTWRGDKVFPGGVSSQHASRRRATRARVRRYCTCEPARRQRPHPRRGAFRSAAWPWRPSWPAGGTGRPEPRRTGAWPCRRQHAGHVRLIRRSASSAWPAAMACAIASCSSHTAWRTPVDWSTAPMARRTWHQCGRARCSIKGLPEPAYTAAWKARSASIMAATSRPRGALSPAGAGPAGGAVARPGARPAHRVRGAPGTPA